jgi:hypothetical protein
MKIWLQTDTRDFIKREDLHDFTICALPQVRLALHSRAPISMLQSICSRLPSVKHGWQILPSLLNLFIIHGDPLRVNVLRFSMAG